MKRAHTTIQLLLAALLYVGISSTAISQEKAPKEKAAEGKKAGAKGKKGAETDTAAALDEGSKGLGAFGKLLPLNEKNIDVKIPSFKDGRPSSLLRAGSMTRVDDENMELEKTDIRLYGELQDKDVRVQLVTGLYHMPTQVLTSDQRSRVSRADFEIEGDAMIFDTRTQQGKLVGNVQMTIFDTDSLMGAPAPQAAQDGKKKPAPDSKSAATAVKTDAKKPDANEKK